jgi:hypothetical protein
MKDGSAPSPKLGADAGALPAFQFNQSISIFGWRIEDTQTHPAQRQEARYF